MAVEEIQEEFLKEFPNRPTVVISSRTYELPRPRPPRPFIRAVLLELIRNPDSPYYNS